MSDLFRKEVRGPNRTMLVGKVSVAQPLRIWVLAALCAAAAIAVLLLLFFGEYTRRSRVHGELVPDLGLSVVVAPYAGVVTSVAVREGDEVSSKQPLMFIEAPRVTTAGREALEVMLESQNRRRDSVEVLAKSRGVQLQIQSQSAESRRDSLRMELSQITIEMHARAEQVRIGRETLLRYREMARQRFISAVQLNEHEQSFLEYSAAYHALVRQASSMRRSLLELDQLIAELPHQMETERAGSNRDLAMLRQQAVEMEVDGMSQLRAPVAGLVTARTVDAGQAVGAGQTLLTLLPEGASLLAHLLVPSSAVGFIKPGQSVLLRYRAYPYQKFGSHQGKVVQISRSAVAISDQGLLQDPVYRVSVSLGQQYVRAYGRMEPLKPGMAVEADIMGERRRLYEWVLEPLYSVTGKVGDNS